MSSQNRSRWVGVGASGDRDARTAGRAAADAAIGSRDTPQLLVVFSSDDYDLQALVDGIADRAPDVPLIGCSTAGEIGNDTVGDNTVVVTALGGGGFTIETSVGRNASSDLHAAGRAAAVAGAATGACPHRALLLLTDGLAGDQQEIVRGAYATLGAGTRIVGGCAGDDLRMKQTRQLWGTEVLTDAVVAAAIGSDSPIGIGVQHGWRPVGERMLVTSSGGNRVYRLDDRPALDVYLDVLGAPPAAREDQETFTNFAITHPLGLERRSGVEVRFVGEANFEDRSLGCIAEVPQGELAWIMEGDSDSVLAATDSACDDASAQLDGSEPIGVIAFDCIARRGVLGDPGIGREIERIRKRFPASPLAGFYTYGEFARTEGTRGFHNQTLVVLALS